MSRNIVAKKTTDDDPMKDMKSIMLCPECLSNEFGVYTSGLRCVRCKRLVQIEELIECSLEKI